MNGKSTVESKTLWFAAITAAIAVYDQMQPFIPQEWMPRILLAVGFLNGVLRFLTHTPVKGGRGS